MADNVSTFMPDTSATPLAVLIADDNRDAADSLATLLGLLGHQVRVAYNGAAALELAFADPPDCAILDIDMPILDGYATARELRSHPSTRDIKLIAHTGFGEAKHAAKIHDAGFDVHLVKGRMGLTELQEVITMVRELKELAEKTRKIAENNVELTMETKGLLQQAKTEFSETKQEIREVKDTLKEVREELKEVKEELKDLRNESDAHQ